MRPTIAMSAMPTTLASVIDAITGQASRQISAVESARGRATSASGVAPSARVPEGLAGDASGSPSSSTWPSTSRAASASSRGRERSMKRPRLTERAVACYAELRRELEHDAFGLARLRLDLRFAAGERAQPLDHRFDEHLGRRRAGGDADAADAGEPRGLDLLRRLHEMSRQPRLARDLDQAVAVRRLRRAHHQQQLRLAD